MYSPAHFTETDVARMHALMGEYPLAAIVTLGANGLDANHIPLQLAEGASPFGVLQGHVARANPLAKAAADLDVLVIFRGANCYISPSGYASKAEHGRVVPTWNYAAVHAHGRLRVIEDPQWLARQIEALTTRHEAGQATPWSVSDAPDDYIEKMRSAIVGIEIEITRLAGKWKTSQNQPAANRLSLSATLEARGDDEAKTMAALIRQHDAK
ncbi:FMN-binding negative transcriptional regulator [Denitromonas ohlonensis]|uniref:FMN-binding negative transcriptional regulator n=2 Tax=Denitromonas TaxID=139331 RepID=A0A557SLE8_9RHOO|nr:FMN-binding negative transcriptional regulator [Denitromonas ohlonensis]TVO67852.1 FMN-binding negative transcriptional regulator [Denitromonas ohlonensis]TVO78245.1 FMN-binding negative transcriptional regulator [Denitromonas ohlonensis]